MSLSLASLAAAQTRPGCNLKSVFKRDGLMNPGMNNHYMQIAQIIFDELFSSLEKLLLLCCSAAGSAAWCVTERTIPKQGPFRWTSGRRSSFSSKVLLALIYRCDYSSAMLSVEKANMYARSTIFKV